MSIVNFAIPQTLDLRIKNIIKTKGFSSKAELFRFALIRYLDHSDSKPPFADDSEIASLTQEIGNLVTKKIAIQKLPSLQKQMERLE